MFTVRKAQPTDFDKILSLYKKVATLEIGIARNPSEISDTYIKGFMEHAHSSGIELVIDHPAKQNEVIAEIHCYKMGPSKFDHVLGELTIAVSPEFHGQGVGKLIFQELLTLVETTRPDILRVELVAQESNQRAINFYKNLGFVIEGRFENRIKLGQNKYEADIPMAWFNKGFSS